MLVERPNRGAQQLIESVEPVGRIYTYSLLFPTLSSHPPGLAGNSLSFDIHVQSGLSVT